MSSLRVAASNGSTFTKALNPFCSVPGGAKEELLIMMLLAINVTNKQTNKQDKRGEKFVSKRSEILG